MKRNESFVFETVVSDPAGGKLAFLRQTQQAGYTVVSCYIGLSRAEISAERVAMRVSQGGHDVPARKLMSPYPRTLANLKAAIGVLPHIFFFDNTAILFIFDKRFLVARFEKSPCCTRAVGFTGRGHFRNG